MLCIAADVVINGVLHMRPEMGACKLSFTLAKSTLHWHRLPNGIEVRVLTSALLIASTKIELIKWWTSPR